LLDSRFYNSIFIVYENDKYPSSDYFNIYTDVTSQLAILIHSVEYDEQKILSLLNNYQNLILFVTDDTLDNPYNSIPTYFKAFLDLLIRENENTCNKVISSKDNYYIAFMSRLFGYQSVF